VRGGVHPHAHLFFGYFLLWAEQLRLRNVYDHVKDETIREKALALIETEDDLKYRKKYATVWRDK